MHSSGSRNPLQMRLLGTFRCVVPNLPRHALNRRIKVIRVCSLPFLAAFHHRTKLLRADAKHPSDKPSDLLAHPTPELLALLLEPMNFIERKTICR